MGKGKGSGLGCLHCLFLSGDCLSDLSLPRRAVARLRHSLPRTQ